MDRPAGMDSTKMTFPTPTQKTPAPKSEMGAVVKLAAGPVDSAGGGKSRTKAPKVKA